MILGYCYEKAPLRPLPPSCEWPHSPASLKTDGACVSRYGQSAWTANDEAQNDAHIASSGVSRVWQAWHVPWASLWRGCKIAWQKLKCLFTVFEPLFCALYIYKLQTCINSAPLPVRLILMHLSRACCARTLKHYDETVILRQNTTVRHCDRTRTLACLSTRPHPSHAIRKDKPIRNASFQARRYWLESDWDEFKSVAVSIWLLRKVQVY